MAENDSHYNGTADTTNMDDGNMNSRNMDNESMDNESMNNGIMNSGNIDNGNMDNGNMDNGSMDSWNMNNENMDNWNMNNGNMDNWNMNNGNMDSRNMNNGTNENSRSAMNTMNGQMAPAAANTTIAIPWTPDFTSCPGCGIISPQSYGQVRFLNASTNGMTVNISIDGTMYAINSRFGTLSNYDWISDGFHTVTVQRANGIRSTLLQQTFPFMADQKVTMVLTDSAEGGLEIIRVIDSGCRNLPAGSGCFRFANMTYNGSNLDLMMSGQTIFRNVRYQSVSSYKQAVAGVYQFSAVTATSYTFMRELPIIVVGIIGSSLTNRETVFTFHTRIQAGRNYTAYLIGNNWSNSPMQVIIAED